MSHPSTGNGVHVLDPTRHKKFLSEQRRDAYTQAPFTIGAQVVVCSACGSAHMLTSWEIMGNQCCGCRCATISTRPLEEQHNETLDFRTGKTAGSPAPIVYAGTASPATVPAQGKAGPGAAVARNFFVLILLGTLGWMVFGTPTHPGSVTPPTNTPAPVRSIPAPSTLSEPPTSPKLRFALPSPSLRLPPGFGLSSPPPLFEATPQLVGLTDNEARSVVLTSLMALRNMQLDLLMDCFSPRVDWFGEGLKDHTAIYRDKVRFFRVWKYVSIEPGSDAPRVFATVDPLVKTVMFTYRFQVVQKLSGRTEAGVSDNIWRVEKTNGQARICVTKETVHDRRWY